jgi:hypothetical protein
MKAITPSREPRANFLSTLHWIRPASALSPVTLSSPTIKLLNESWRVERSGITIHCMALPTMPLRSSRAATRT